MWEGQRDPGYIAHGFTGKQVGLKNQVPRTERSHINHRNRHSTGGADGAEAVTAWTPTESKANFGTKYQWQLTRELNIPLELQS